MFTRKRGARVVIHRVMEGPAQRAGVEEGDEVLAVNGVSIEAILKGTKAPPADERFVQIKLRRDGQEFSKQIPVDVLVK